jgi:hypothetical protein
MSWAFRSNDTCDAMELLLGGVLAAAAARATIFRFDDEAESQGKGEGVGGG